MIRSSPYGKHAVELEPTGETVQGQALFRLRVDGIRMESTRYTLGAQSLGVHVGLATPQ
ncbi:hypothetical protein JQX13_11145 [Archangium violaceum]|uniref:hypothetical protein n=1 Tax=Archangium violaceum TaxID=83451 RepID=UPI00193B4330|nr:hypothetical protein [Archangium violaceum]QRK10586.1 hypothetical protein JQX13_11145 [Archangium violaceum]